MPGALAVRYDGLLNKLSRITTGGKVIPELEGLRFIAILSVLLLHAAKILTDHCLPAMRHDIVTQYLLGESLGVPLFFVISGFLLAMPFIMHHLKGQPPVLLQKYYTRRITRLEPPFIIAMILAFALHVKLENQAAKTLMPYLITVITYTNNLVHGRDNNPINAVSWSLEIEVQFYVLAPFIAMMFAIRNPTVRRGLLIGGVFFFLQLYKVLSMHMQVPACLISNMPLFLGGFLLADLYLVSWDRKPVCQRRFDVLGIAIWLLLPLYFNVHGLPQSGPTLLAIVMVYSALRSVWFKQLLSRRTFVTLGGMCYSIYLTHMLMYWLISDHLVGWAPSTIPGVTSLTYSAILGLSSFPLAAAFFILVEKPCMRRQWQPRRVLVEHTIDMRPPFAISAAA